MIRDPRFPNLTASNHRVTSPVDTAYNCIAWAARDTQHWWQPGRFWPTAESPDEFGIGVLEQAFMNLGYSDCDDPTFEPGFDKVALYGDFFFYTHAARQLANGKWTSKLGESEDLEHDSPDDVAGGDYGHVMQFMKRPVEPTNPRDQ